MPYKLSSRNSEASFRCSAKLTYRYASQDDIRCPHTVNDEVPVESSDSRFLSKAFVLVTGKLAVFDCKNWSVFDP